MGHYSGKTSDVKMPKVDDLRHLKEESMLFEFRTRELDPNIIASYLSYRLFKIGFYDKDKMNEVTLALNEALINAIEHGNLGLNSELKEKGMGSRDSFVALREKRLEDPTFAGRKIVIKYKYTVSKAEISIADEGQGFDHARVLNSFASKIRVYGRGLMLIKFVMDEIRFNERGNEIIMVKYK